MTTDKLTFEEWHDNQCCKQSSCTHECPHRAWEEVAWHARDAELVDLQAQLVASREMMKCGHARSYWIEDKQLGPVSYGHLGHCTICTEIQAERAAVLEQVEDMCHEKYEKENDEIAMNAYLIVRDAVHYLISTTNRSALDRYVEEARLEGWHEGLKDDMTQMIHSIAEESDDKLTPDAIALKQALLKAISKLVEEKVREGHIVGLEEAMKLAIQERDTPESEGGNIVRHDACDNVRLFIRIRLDELRASPRSSAKGEGR